MMDVNIGYRFCKSANSEWFHSTLISCKGKNREQHLPEAVCYDHPTVLLQNGDQKVKPSAHSRPALLQSTLLLV